MTKPSARIPRPGTGKVQGGLAPGGQRGMSPTNQIPTPPAPPRPTDSSPSSQPPKGGK